MAGVACALRLVELHVPHHTSEGDNAHLVCRYEITGDRLYAVKWYKDGREFYRYVPEDSQPVQTFPLPGVNVQMESSQFGEVELEKVTHETSGRYRCEVSGEAPLFQTVSDHGELIVVVIPEEGPLITGASSHYRVGDDVRANCTVRAARPAAGLAWRVNGAPPSPAHVLGPWHTPALPPAPTATFDSIIQLSFRLEPQHFHNGDIHFKCLASVSTVYERSHDTEAVDGEPPRPPASAESREPPLTPAPASAASHDTSAPAPPTPAAASAAAAPAPAESRVPHHYPQDSSASTSASMCCGVIALRGWLPSALALSSLTLEFVRCRFSCRSR